MPACCSPLCTARVRSCGAWSGGAGYPSGRGGLGRCESTRLDNRSLARGAGANSGPREEGGGVQHDRAQPPARHSAGARPRRTCAHVGGGGGGDVQEVDRSLFHITSNANVRRASGIMLGRCSNVTPNEPEFGMNAEDIAQYWCRRSGIPWLGRADIGHDTHNKIVPFGAWR